MVTHPIRISVWTWPLDGADGPVRLGIDYFTFTEQTTDEVLKPAGL